MCPRPRVTTDEELLTATGRAVSKHGPADLTLAHVSAESGVAPATLVQRFGSKRGLLLASIRAASKSPLAAILAVADCMAQMAVTPEALANHLAFLSIDLTDPEFHRLALEQARVSRREIQGLLDAAVKSRELSGCDTGPLARAIQVTLNGGLITWAIEREGTAAEWLRHDLEALLKPYRSKPGRRRTARRK